MPSFQLLYVCLTVFLCLCQGLVAERTTFAYPKGVVAMEQNVNSTSSSGKKYVFDANIPARLQWLHNDGYCGEVSLNMAGLKYGQYFSQYDLRDIAAVKRTDIQTTHFYLVGENDQRASDLVKLSHEEYDNTNIDAKGYLAWAKKMTRKGYAVTITVYMNYYLFYGIEDKDAGETDYDHIVSVSRVESDYDDDEYHPDDIVVMEDHGLYAPGYKPIYLFSYTMKDFIGTRQKANDKRGAVYTVPDKTYNYGIAHTGILLDSGVASQMANVRVDTSVNYEDPEIGVRSEERPAPMELTLTVTVTGMENGVAYKLYKYVDETKVPTSKFNQQSANAVATFDIVGPTYKMTEKIMSDQKTIYRAVKASAP